MDQLAPLYLALLDRANSRELVEIEDFLDKLRQQMTVIDTQADSLAVQAESFYKAAKELKKR